MSNVRMRTIADLERELEDNILLHGTDHESSAIIYSNLGGLHFNAEEYDKSTESYETALRIATDTLGDQHEFVIDLRYRLGRVIEARAVTEEKVKASKQYRREVLELRQQYDSKMEADQAKKKGKKGSSTAGAKKVQSDSTQLLAIIEDPALSKRYSLDDMDSTMVYSDMAEELRLGGDLEQAQPLYIKSIALRREKFGYESPALPPVLLNYAELLRQRGNFEAAKVILEEALAIDVKVYGKQHRETAAVLNSLGQIHRFMGDLALSQQLLVEALQIRRLLFGDLDLSVGASLNNLAELNREMRNYQEAIKYHHLSIEAFESAGGMDHPGTINAKGNLGITLRRYARVSEEQGEQLIQETVQYLHQHDYHDAHPWLVKFDNENLIGTAQKLSLQGKHDQSLEMFDSLLKKKQQLMMAGTEASPPKALSGAVVPVGDSSSAEVAQELLLIGKGKFTSMLGKARSLIMKARHVEARDLLIECSRFPVDLLGDAEDRISLTAEMKTLMTSNALQSADFDKAAALRVETLQLLVDHYGPASDKLVGIMILIAQSYRGCCSYDEAETFINEAISIVGGIIKTEQQVLGKATGANCVIYLEALVELADLHKNIGNHTVAAPLLAEALDLCHSHLLEDEVIMGECYSSLASSEVLKGNYPKALEYYQCALDNRTKNFGRSHPKTASTVAHTAAVHLIKCEYSLAAQLLHDSQMVREEYFHVVDKNHPALGHSYYLQAKLHHSLCELDDAEAIMRKALELRKRKLGNRHASTAQAMHALGEILISKNKLSDATEQIESAYLIRTDLFSASCANHNDITQSMASIAHLKALRGQYLESAKLFEESKQLRQTLLQAIGSRFHSDLAGTLLRYGWVLIVIGKAKAAANMFGLAGGYIYQSFESEQHLRIADCLYHAAEASKALGLYKQAKYQYSTCMAIRFRYLGKAHPDVLQILYASADNMRLVGYFSDALNACAAIETAVEQQKQQQQQQQLSGQQQQHEEQKYLLLVAQSMKLRADVYCDKGLYVKAEHLYQTALGKFHALYGDSCIYAIEIQVGLCRCIQNDAADRESAFRRIGSIAKKLLGAESHITQDIISNIAMTKLNRRPEEGNTCLATLKDQLLPFYSSSYGKHHPYTIHTNGRIGLFMNMLKKDSGRKIVQKAVKALDEYKHFAFTQDHPWVLELGGFLTRSSQERLSHVVEIQCLSSWSMPRYEGDASFGKPNRNFWLDLSNFDPDSWGMLHFYGVEQVAVDGLLPIIAQAKEKERANDSQSLKASPPSAEVVPSTSTTEKKKITKNDDDSTSIHASNSNSSEDRRVIVVDGSEVEIKTLQDAEDLLKLESDNRKSLEEQLEAETASKRIVDQKLADAENEREMFRRMYEESMHQMRELAEAQRKAIEDEVAAALQRQADEAARTTAEEEEATKLAALQQEEAEKALKESGDDDDDEDDDDDNDGGNKQPDGGTTEAPADVEVVADQEQTAAEVADLKAAEFLHARALALIAEGSYVKALPLLQECLRIRTTHIPTDEITTRTMMDLARNYTLLHNWDESSKTMQSCTVVVEHANGIESLNFADALLVKCENWFHKGMYLEVSKTMSRSIKTLTKVVERSNDKKDPASNSLLGRSLCFQALNYLKLGKLSESKAAVDRGHAILSKVFDVNHPHNNDVLLVKCYILVYSSKFKESINILDQIFSVRKRMHGDKDHPSYIECLLLQGVSLTGLGKYIEAQGKYNAAKMYVLMYFEEKSLEYAAVLFLEAQLLMKLSDYKESLRLHIEAFKIRQAMSWESYPELSASHQALGELLTVLGRFPEASKHLDRAYFIRCKLFIPSPSSATNVKGDKDKAAGADATPTVQHPLLAETRCAQGNLLRLCGDYEGAKVCMDESLESRQILFGKDNAVYLSGQHYYALLLHDMGDYKSADKLHQRTIKARRQLLGSDHPDLADSLLSETQVLLSLGLVEEAVVVRTEAHSVVQQNFSNYGPLHMGFVELELLDGMKQLLALEKEHDDAENEALQKLIEKEKEASEAKDGKKPLKPITKTSNAKISKAPPHDVKISEVPPHDVKISEAPPHDAKISEELPHDAKISEVPPHDAKISEVPPHDAKINEVPPHDAKISEAPPHDAKISPVPSTTTAIEAPAIVEVNDAVETKANSNEDAVAAAAQVEKEPVEVCPVFDRARFAETCATFERVIASLQRIFSLSSTDRIEAATDDEVVPHPLLMYLKGCIGSVMLLEYLCKRRFVESLSSSDRELFLSNELLKRFESKEILPKPSGLPEIEAAIDDLSAYPSVDETAHCWIKKLSDARGNVRFILDDMEIATNTFFEAEALRRDGDFSEADGMYDEVFLTQVNSLGPGQAATSVVVAETLYAKAMNSRALGEFELSKELFNQCISIYRKTKGNDSEGVMRGILGLTEILTYQGLYDDAHSMHCRVLQTFTSQFGDHSLQAARVRILMAFDLFKLGKLNQALKIGQLAYSQVSSIPAKLNEDKHEDLAQVRLYIAQIQLALGQFSACKESIEIAQTLLDPSHSNSSSEESNRIGTGMQSNGRSNGAGATAPLGFPSDVPRPAPDALNTIALTAVLEVQAEYLLTMSKATEAHKVISTALKQRIKSFGRMSKILEASKGGIGRKRLFFDAYDDLSAETSKLLQSDKKKTVENNDDDDDDDAAAAAAKESQEAKDRKRGKGKRNEVGNGGDVVEDEDVDDDDVDGDDEDGTGVVNAGFETKSVSSFARFCNTKPPLKPPMVQRGIPVQSHPMIADCLVAKGRIALVLGNFAEAKESLDAAMSMLNLLFSRPSLKKLCISHELAVLTFKKGKIEEARMLHLSLLQQRLQMCEEDHPDKADSLFQLASINNLLSRFDDSTQILTESLNIRKKVFGESHWKVAEVLSECALVLHAKGLFADSEALCDKSMVIAKHYFGDLHLLVATIQIVQAANARENGLYEQANACIEQAKSNHLVLLGENHADTAQCMYEQALVMRSLGKLLDAKKLLETCIRIQSEKLSKNHPMTAITTLAMAFNSMDLAKYSSADKLYHRSLALIRKSCGKDHVLVAQGMSGMAENYKCQGKYAEAKDMHEQVLYLRRKLLGDRHQTIAESIYSVSEINMILAKYDDAIKGFDDALAIQRMALGQNHPAIATSLHGLGKVNLAQGKVSEAKSQHDRAFAMRRSCLPADHPDIGDSQFCNAQVYRRLGKYEQANALFERCLSSVRDSRGPRHPFIATIIYSSAEVCIQMGRFHQAEALLLESLKIRSTVFKAINPDHPEIIESYFGLAENLRVNRGMCEYLHEKDKKIQELAKIGRSTMSSAKIEKEETTSSGGGPLFILYDDDVLQEVTGEKEEQQSVAAAASMPPDQNDPSSSLLVSGTVISPMQDTALEGEDGDDEQDQHERQKVHDDDAAAADSEGDDDSDYEDQIADFNYLTEDAKTYKALPIIEKVLRQLAPVFPEDHPVVLQSLYSKAECLRSVGKCDAAFELHESVVTTRRKVFGDNHFDVVVSMLALACSLQSLGKIYPESAAGAVDSKEVRKAKQAISLGVSLIDHFNSVVAPINESKPPGSSSAMVAVPSRQQKGRDYAWEFLSKSDSDTLKKTALKIPRGFMGYQFPPVKRIERKETANVVSRPKKVRAGDAKWLLDSAVTAQKRVFGEASEHPITASLLFARGELLRARGDYSSAMHQYEASLVMRRKLFRGNHPCIAECINAIAELFRIENRFKQALPLLDKALEIRLEAYDGPHHPSVADSKNNLGMLAFSEGRFADAEHNFRVALNICEELLGHAHPSTAFCLNNYAALLHASGQFSLALPLYLKTLKAKQSLFGEEHFEIASALNNIGLLYKSMGKLDDAEKYYQDALVIQRKVFGTTNKDVATTLNNLASLFALQSKLYQAKEAYKESLSIRCSLFGQEHPTVASTLNNYASLLFAMSEYDEAKDIFEDALRIRKKVLGDSHPSVGETLNNIGLLLYKRGDLKEALPLYEQALEIKRLSYGDMNPSVAISLNNLAGLYHKLGRFDRAAGLYGKALEIRRAVLGETHEDTLLVGENLKLVEADKRKWVAAVDSSSNKGKDEDDA